MKYKRSKTLEKFLDDEIARFEREEQEANKPANGNDDEFQKIILEEIAELESRCDSLNEDDKEYLEWLKQE